MEKRYNVRIDFLSVHTRQIEVLTNDILMLRDKYDARVDEEDATAILEAIDRLKTVLKTTPLLDE